MHIYTADSGFNLTQTDLKTVYLCYTLLMKSVNHRYILPVIAIMVTTILTTLCYADNDKPLTGYLSTDREGVSRSFSIGYHRGSHATSIDKRMKIKSFKLTRGHMATLAVATITDKEPGTSRSWNEGIRPFWQINHSKVFIASKEDLQITLKPPLQGKVNWIRVVKYRPVTKKGMCTHNSIENCNKLNATWYYNWGIRPPEDHKIEYVPMIKGKGAIANNGLWVDILYRDVKRWINMVHLSAFNEPDGDDQACMTPQEAIAAWPRLLETGARLGSPAPREDAAWLDPFMTMANKKGYRVDYICLHWYDWGGWKKDSDPSRAFDRFVAKMTEIHNKYDLPIWVTEFNANKNREMDVHIEFLKLALPWLEKTPWIERYSFFEPFGNNAPFFDYRGSGKITPVGKLYRDQKSIDSTPQQPDAL